MFLNETRKEYTKYELTEESVHKNPINQFSEWFDFAKKNALFEPNAMSISTSVDNKPTCRIVLLKKFNEHGFVFFTNFNSKKAQEINSNPYIAATIFWPNLERQIRIEGITEKISEKESDAYFETRPRDSQLSAWASDQSGIVNDRNELDNRLEKYKRKFPNIVPRPDFWGGYRIIPNFYEFWQGRENRYHDRICYKAVEKKWEIFRLYP